ncbi:hypothetical protein, partial [Brucella sp. 22210]|uniref:hypothetical protein n=1 Tax=Brucella sp. 22210 TaxID=3453892 RepID=UPI003F875BB2
RRTFIRLEHHLPRHSAWPRRTAGKGVRMSADPNETLTLTMANLEQVVDNAAAHQLDTLRIALAEKVRTNERERCARLVEQRAIDLDKLGFFSEAIELRTLVSSIRTDG